MKVQPSTSPSLAPAAGAQRTQAQQADTPAVAGDAGTTAAPAAGSAGNQDADVNLSTLSGQLRDLSAAGPADIDLSHVESIKAAIRSGSLTIDTGKIADGVLQTARDLLKRPVST